MADLIDCAVVGGGPAGLVAALTLLRFGRTVLIADRGGSRAAGIAHSDNVPGFPDGVSGRSLLTLLHQQVERHGRPAWSGEVLRVQAHDGNWRLELHDAVVQARRVIFATGLIDRRPRLQEVETAIARGVLRFPPYGHHFESRETRVAVIGDDEHAASEASFLRTYYPSVTLLTEGQSALSPDAGLRLMGNGVRVAAVQPNSLRFARDLIWATDATGNELAPFDLAYAALGVEPQTKLLADLDVVLDPSGRVCVDADQRTSRPGLYAAGDAVRALGQLTVVFGEAAIAATAVHNSLLATEAGRDVRPAPLQASSPPRAVARRTRPNTVRALRRIQERSSL